MIRVFLVDDHHLFLSGVRSELKEAFDVVGTAGTVADATSKIAETAPDVVLLDVHLPDGSGEAVIRACAVGWQVSATVCRTNLQLRKAIQRPFENQV